MIECGKLFASAACPPTYSLYLNSVSLVFITMTTMDPSVLRNPVDNNWARDEDTAIRLAPGRMYFEKWPM